MSLTWLSLIFPKTGFRGTADVRKREARARLNLELLERRDAPAVTASLAGGILSIVSSAPTDPIAVKQSNLQISVSGVTGVFNTGQIQHIQIQRDEENGDSFGGEDPTSDSGTAPTTSPTPTPTPVVDTQGGQSVDVDPADDFTPSNSTYDNQNGSNVPKGPSWSPYPIVHMDGSYSLYLSASGTLYEAVGGSGWQVEEGGVTHLTVTDGQDFVTLHNDGTLWQTDVVIASTTVYKMGSGWTPQYYVSSKTMQLLASNVQSFHRANNGKLYFLTTSDYLYSYANGNSSRLSGNVQSFAMGPGGQTLYFLTTSDDLYKDVNGNATQIDSTVTSISLADGGSILLARKQNGAVDQFTA
jgi:hypothetical protein